MSEAFGEVLEATTIALLAVIAAFMAAVTPSMVRLARRGGRLLVRLAEAKLDEIDRREASWVAKYSIAAAEEAAHAGRIEKGAAKLEHAKEVARSISPPAQNKLLDEPNLGTVLNAELGRLRPSLQTPSASAYPPPGTVLSVPVRVISSEPPPPAQPAPLPPVPRAARVPVAAFGDEDSPITRPERSRR